MQSVFPSTMRRYRDNLQTIPWLLLAWYGVLTLFCGMLFSLLLPRDLQRPFTRCLLAVPLIVLVAKDLACYPLAFARWQSAGTRGESLLRRLIATLPPEFLGYIRLERAMWQGFFSWVLRRPHTPRPAGMQLGYLERGSYGTAIGCALLALFVEMPIDVLIASLLAKTPHEAHTLHIVSGVLAAYGFVWVLGDHWHVRGRGQHILTDTSLELDVGVRAFGSIPLDAIASCARLNELRAEWCKRHGHFLHATRKVTPFDAPNLVLLLKPGSDVRLHLLQVARGGDGPVFLYLDRPEQLAAVLPPPA